MFLQFRYLNTLYKQPWQLALVCFFFHFILDFVLILHTHAYIHTLNRERERAITKKNSQCGAVTWQRGIKYLTEVKIMQIYLYIFHNGRVHNLPKMDELLNEQQSEQQQQQLKYSNSIREEYMVFVCLFIQRKRDRIDRLMLVLQNPKPMYWRYFLWMFWSSDCVRD